MISRLNKMDVKNKRVFLRADLNVPYENGTIVSDHRLQALLPTLDLLIKKKARIILATHRGRPQGCEELLSTKHLLPWFVERRYRISWSPLHDEIKTDVGTITLLENLRFYDDQNPDNTQLADRLRKLADIYVSDAWGALHKHDTSLVLLAKLFEPHSRTIGLLVEQEMKHLKPLLKPDHPYLMIIGGAKLQTKLPDLIPALDRADKVLVLPPLAFTLLKAHGKSVGQSLIDDQLLSLAEKILMHAPEKLILPEDFLVAAASKDGPLSWQTSIPTAGFGIAVGPKTLELYTKLIQESQMLFLNGIMGFLELPETLEPMKKLLQFIAQSNTYSVIGGGDSVAAVTFFDLQRSMNFCSTGGGSTLRYILHEELPALTPFYSGYHFLP